MENLARDVLMCVLLLFQSGQSRGAWTQTHSSHRESVTKQNREKHICSTMYLPPKSIQCTSSFVPKTINYYKDKKTSIHKLKGITPDIV